MRAACIIGIDNNMRRTFFGPDGDTAGSEAGSRPVRNYRHADIDIRDRAGILDIFREVRPFAVVHCAAQPKP